MSSPIVQKFTSVLSNIRINSLIDRTYIALNRLHSLTLTNYHRSRLLLLGPVRNTYLVSRELVNLVGRERQWQLPPNEMLHQAKAEYKGLWHQIIGMSSVDALWDRMKTTSWRQIGLVTLIVGEVMSLYYLGKMITRITKKAGRLILHAA